MSSPRDDINSDETGNTVSSKYYDIDELQNLKITNKSNSLSLFIEKHVLFVRTFMTFNTF